jgi:hypothetical protein
MNAFFTFCLIIVCIWLFFKIFGKYLLTLLVKIIAKRFGFNAKIFDATPKKPKPSSPSHLVDDPPILSNDVGEYVDFEEIEEKQ